MSSNKKIFTEQEDMLTIDHSADKHTHDDSEGVDLFNEQKEVVSELVDETKVWTAVPRHNVAAIAAYADSIGLTEKGKIMFLSTIDALQISSSHIEFLDITKTLSPSVVEDMLVGSVIIETGGALPSSRNRGRGTVQTSAAASVYRGFRFTEEVNQKAVIARFVTRTSLPVPNERGSKFGEAKVLYTVFPETEFTAVNPETNGRLVDKLGKPAGFRPAFRLMARKYYDAPGQGLEAWFNQSPRNTTTSQFGLQLPTLIREAALDLGATDDELCVRSESWVDRVMTGSTASSNYAQASTQYSTGGSNLRGSAALESSVENPQFA